MALVIQNVNLKYGDAHILRDVNATVEGRIVGFLGLSGVGKTSLLRIIAGLNKPTSGTVTIDGKPVEYGDVGVVSQAYTLFEHRTVFGNLLLSAMRKEKNKKGAKEKVWEFLKEFDLEEQHAHHPSQLSGGQRQRCAIGQQILNSNKFILMDEPFSGLDMLMEEKTCALLSRVSQQTSIIVITHDITAAVSIADHVWIMGHDRESSTGKHIPGARIIKEYNMVQHGLEWDPHIQTSPALVDFVRQIKEEFRADSNPNGGPYVPQTQKAL